MVQRINTAVRAPASPWAATRGSAFGQDELDAVVRLVRSDATLTAGEERAAFEREFAHRVGARHAITTTSGTVALVLALGVLGLREGDEVVVTTQTFHATAQPLLLGPATVRFCDVEADTLNMDPEALSRIVGPRTRAIVLVHYGGVPADMRRITALARSVGAVVVEDCAHALGADTPDGPPGSLGDLGCFSFHSSKNISTLGEGGMVTTSDDALAARLRRLRDNRDDVLTAGRASAEPSRERELGRLAPWTVYGDEWLRPVETVRRAGTNATMSEAAAAVGRVQLAKLDRLSLRRAAIVATLTEVVERHAAFRVQRVAATDRSGDHLFTFFCDAGADSRYRVLEGMAERGIEVRLRYAPLHLAPQWAARGHRSGGCPVAETDWFERHLNLPCHPGLDDEHVERLADALGDVLARI